MKAGWQVKRLGEVCRLINGRAYKQTELLTQGKYRVLRVGNFFTSDHWYHSDLELEPDKYCDTGDLLYAWSASFGPRIWKGEKVIYHYHIWKVAPDSECVVRDYLYYFFEWDKEKIKTEHGAGTTMVHVSKSSMDAREIPLPPLEEQKRIVAILDEAFEGLVRARAHTETNLQNSRELFSSFLESAYAALSAAPRRRLAALCDKRVITYGVIKLGDEFADGVPCLRTSNVKPLKIETHGLKRINPALSKEFSRTILRGGEVLVNVRGTLGGVAVVPEDMKGWNVSREVAVVPVDREAVDADYLAFFIATKQAQKWLTGVLKGAAYTGINIEDLRELQIPIPNRETQLQLVDSIAAVQQEVSRLETATKTKLADLDALRQSLLQKAFAGELT